MSKAQSERITLKIFFATIYTWILVGILYAVQFALFVPPILIWTFLFDKKERKVMYWLTRFFIKLFFSLFRISKFNFDISSIKKAKGPRIYILNHASQFDTFLIYLLPDRVKFFVKAVYTSLPFIGWTISLTGNILVKKPSDMNDDTNTLNKGLQVLKNGIPLLIFPEGTKSKTGDIGRFKTGGFRMAHEAKAEIVPVVLDTWNSIRPGGGLWARDTKVWMKALRPYKYEEYKNIDDKTLAKMIKIKMTEKLLNIRDTRRKQETNYYRHNEKYKIMDENALNKVLEFKKKNKMLI